MRVIKRFFKGLKKELLDLQPKDVFPTFVVLVLIGILSIVAIPLAIVLVPVALLGAFVIHLLEELHNWVHGIETVD